MLTVVEEMDPGHPESWQAAAKIAVCSIFNSVDKVLEHFRVFEESNESHLVSSAGAAGKIDNSLDSVLEGLHLLDIQFEGMLNNSKWIDSDQMYWAEEWKILGTLAAAAGIKNGNLNNLAPALGAHPEIEISKTASAGVFESWMLREEITSTIIKKQTDYGHHNIARFGRHGILVRCHDKIARLKNLHLSRGGHAANEALCDTYVDIVGYSAIGLMWEREWFLLELTR